MDLAVTKNGRRRAYLALAIAGVMAATMGGAIALAPGGSGASATSSLDSLANLLGVRSPGKRTEGKLTKVKIAARETRTPGTLEDILGERVLGKVFPSGEEAQAATGPEQFVSVAPVTLAALPTGIGEFVGPFPLLANAESDSFGAGGGPVFVGGGGPAFVGSGGGSGGGGAGGPSGGGGGGPVDGGVGGTNPTLSPTAPVAAVPEPGTWALMLLGMGLCGAALRRRRRDAKAGLEPSWA